MDESRRADASTVGSWSGAISHRHCVQALLGTGCQSGYQVRHTRVLQWLLHVIGRSATHGGWQRPRRGARRARERRGPPRATADSILAKHRGYTILVVGHSNTVPALVAALGAPQPADICDAGYDNVFVVSVPASGPATVTRLHFGAVTAGCMK